MMRFIEGLIFGVILTYVNWPDIAQSVNSIIISIKNLGR